MKVASNFDIRPMRIDDWPEVSKIYAEALAASKVTDKEVPRDELDEAEGDSKDE